MQTRLPRFCLFSRGSFTAHVSPPCWFFPSQRGLCVYESHGEHGMVVARITISFDETDPMNNYIGSRYTYNRFVNDFLNGL